MYDELDLTPLFQPLTIGGLTLPNRFVMPAMTRMWCVGGAPTPQLTDYYCRRAAGGVGLLITEGCAIDHPTSTQNPVLARMDERTVEDWAACVQAVRAAGAPMLLQIAHEGAIRQDGGEGPYADYPTLSPSGLVGNGKENGRAATAAELEEIKDGYVRSALLAQQAGFAGVEIHAAHGSSLLDQFLWAETNRRMDEYGGPGMAGRARFPAEVVRAVRQATGTGFVISFRFSQWKEVNYEARIAETPDELKPMLDAISDAGADALHASARRFWKAEWPGSGLGIAGWTKALTGATVIAVGSVGLDIDVMTNLNNDEAHSTGAAGLKKLLRRFNNREFDLISVGRSLIGDPEWVEKVRTGRFGDIRMFAKKDLLGDMEMADFNPYAEH